MSRRTILTAHEFLKLSEGGKLVGAKCMGCGSVKLPPRPICPRCGDSEYESVELSGEGAVESFTVIHVRPTPLESSGPYIVALVRLSDGPLIMGRLIGADPNRPDEVKIGSKVRFEVLREKRADKEQALIAFSPT